MKDYDSAAFQSVATDDSTDDSTDDDDCAELDPDMLPCWSCFKGGDDDV